MRRRIQNPRRGTRTKGSRPQRPTAPPLWKRWWSRILAGLGLFAILGTTWAFISPADWVRPQYLWIKPAPQLATAEAVRRWPALGPAGASQDSVILRLKGEPLPRSLLERSWRVVFYWRLTNAESQSWNLAQQGGQQSKPVSVPDFVATAGPWDIDLTASCPSEFRGLIEVMPVLVSRSDFGTLTDTRAKLPIAPISSKKPPSGSQMGNAVLAETSGTTPGETPSPYRQVESLNANVPIARFRGTLGPESSWNYLRGGREYLFLAPEYCVQAVTDTKGLVLMYAVTTLSGDFGPTFGYWSGNTFRRITLGVTKFSDTHWAPTATWSNVYANRYSYAESFWLSGAAGYQTMLLGSNYLGKPGLSSFRGMGFAVGRATRAQERRIAPSRKVNVVNTFGMCAPDPIHATVPPQFARGGGWIGPTGWDLGSATLSTLSGQDQR